MLDVRKLHMLAELERLGTIAAVARSLNLTAPGISMQLASLERDVGLRLTEKKGRRVAVTPAGRLLARHGHSIVDMLTVAETEADALREGTAGRYRIGAFPTAARTIMPDAWRAIASTPGSTLELRLIELEPSLSLSALEAGDIELAVTHSYTNMPPIDEPQFEVAEVSTEWVRLAVSDEVFAAAAAGTGAAAGTVAAAVGPVDLRDFAKHDWIVPGREWTCYDMVHRATDLAGFEPRAVAMATDFGVQLAFVAAGLGVALIPQLGALDVPAGVSMLELKRQVFRKVLTVTRRSSGSDAGLQRIRSAIGSSAQRYLYEVQ